MERTQRTFIMIKPDGIQRKLVGEVIRRFENRGLKLCGLKIFSPSHDLLTKHYAEHAEKPFFNSLLEYVGSGSVAAMVWEGGNAIEIGRKLVGATNPLDSPPGTIRGDFCLAVGKNLIHGSDSSAAAAREIALWFTPDELVTWEDPSANWIYE